MKQKRSLAMLISSMVIFGTIGIFRRYLPISSPLLAFLRGGIGALFLLALKAVLTRRQKAAATTGKDDAAALEKDAAPLLTVDQKLLWFAIPGALIGLNWVALFEAYRFTTVAIATLCYYMAPTLVILFSPLVLREKLTGKKILCAVFAVFGMALISGVFGGGGAGGSTGILLGLAAAALYATVILINKKAPEADTYEKTIIQLGAAAVCLVPYLLLTGGFAVEQMSLTIVLLLITVGIVHTGAAYALYFGSIKGLKAQTVALLSYIDPVVALLLSAVLLGETLGITGIIGAVLILGACLVSEI